MKTILTLLITVIAAFGISAQTFEMVKDIIPGSGDSNPKGLIATDDYLFFAADHDNGQTVNSRLWKTDGTEVGTEIIYGGANNLINPTFMAVLNGELYFGAASENDGNELWKTDGNTTVKVKNINPAVYEGSNPRYFTEYNGKLYFDADDGTNAYELWVSDGTSAGTLMLKDINPAAGGSYPEYFTEYNGKLYFRADDGTNGTELWETDGTTDGTMKIEPLVSTEADPLNSTSEFVEFDGSLYFSASYNTNGNELWKFTTEIMATSDLATTQVQIYPNPVKDVLHIQTTDKVQQIKLLSINGQQLQSWKGQNSINLSAYPKGIYLVQITTEKGTITRKIVK